MDGELRPLGVWEIVEGGVRLFVRHWLAFAGAILLVIVPLQVLAAGVTLAVAPEQLEWNSGTSAGDDPDVLLWQGIVALIGFLTLLLVTAMSLKAVADARLGLTPSGGRALRFALPRLGGTLAVAVLGGLAGALLQGIVMSIPASLSDGEHVAGAIGMALGGTLATAITAPCSAAIVTLLYMDLRVRKDHFTLGTLADAVGEASARPSDRPREPWPPPPAAEPAPQAPGPP